MSKGKISAHGSPQVNILLMATQVQIQGKKYSSLLSKVTS
jgi:hypothetical protein